MIEGGYFSPRSILKKEKGTPFIMPLSISGLEKHASLEPIPLTMVLSSEQKKGRSLRPAKEEVLLGNVS